MVLDKKGIFEDLKLSTERVKLKTGEVIVSEISGKDYMEAYNSPLSQCEDGKLDGPKFTAMLVVRAVVDEAGERIFTDEDAETLRAGSTARYQKIAAAVNRLNGLAGDVEGN